MSEVFELLICIELLLALAWLMDQPHPMGRPMNWPQDYMG